MQAENRKFVSSDMVDAFIQMAPVSVLALCLVFENVARGDWR
jgi:hypothetical protein